MIPAGHSRMLKSFGLAKEVISANGSVCGRGIKSRNAPGTNAKGCHPSPGALLPWGPFSLVRVPHKPLL